MRRHFYFFVRHTFSRNDEGAFAHRLFATNQADGNPQRGRDDAPKEGCNASVRARRVPDDVAQIMPELLSHAVA